MNTKGKILVFAIILIIFSVVAFLLRDKPEAVPPKTAGIDSEILIQDEDINEENFSGSKPVISGSSILVSLANKYVDEKISEFKINADSQVPKMREDFGIDSPPASYTIFISASVDEGVLSRSIIFNEYYYTGGANGTGIYSTITEDKRTGEIILLKDIVKDEKQKEFTEFVKNKIISWKPEGAENTVVFPEEVNKLSFNSFLDWSMNDENLTIYFDEYEIGPGVLGSVPFEIPLTELQDFLKL